MIQKVKETRAGAERLLRLHENDRQRSLEECERRRELYDQGLIARNDALQAEHTTMTEVSVRVDEDRRGLVETDMAIAEVTLRDELLRLPRLAIGGYSETAMLLCFNSGALWTPRSAPKIEVFFSKPLAEYYRSVRQVKPQLTTACG